MGEPQLEALWDAEDVAKFLKVKLKWVWAETRAGRIPHIAGMGRLYRYDPDVVRRRFSGAEPVKKK